MTASFSFLAVGGLCLGQQLAKGCAAAFVAEEHEVVLSEAAADCAEVGQRQGYIRQHPPSALFGGLEGDAVVALVFLLLLLGGGHAVPAEEGDEVVTAQLDAVADDLLQLVLLGVAHQQGDVHSGFGGAGIARLDGKLHRLVAEAGDGGGVFHGVAVAEDDGVSRLPPHDAGEMVGVSPPQHGSAVGDLGGKIAVRHSSS